MRITGTSSIIGTLTLEMRDAFSTAYRSVSIIHGETLTINDQFRFDTSITNAVSKGLITVTLDSQDHAAQMDLTGGGTDPDSVQTQNIISDSFALTHNNKKILSITTDGNIYTSSSIAAGTSVGQRLLIVIFPSVSAAITISKNTTGLSILGDWVRNNSSAAYSWLSLEWDGTTWNEIDRDHSFATASNGAWSTAEGQNTTANGQASHAEGETTIAQGEASHAEGNSNSAIGIYSHVEGQGSLAIGNASHAEGGSQSIGGSSHSESSGIAAADGSHVEGSGIASGTNSHAEGTSFTGYIPLSCTISGTTVTISGINATAQIPEACNVVLYNLSGGSPTDPLAVRANASGVTFNTNTTFTINAAVGAQTSGQVVCIDTFGINAHSEGSSCQAIGNASHAQGIQSIAVNAGQHAFAMGAFNSAGDAQTSEFVLRTTTSNNVGTKLFLDGAATEIAINSNTTYGYHVSVIARQLNASACAYFELNGFITRGSGVGSTRIVAGTPTSAADAGASTWSVVASANTTSGALTLTVTGQNSKTIQWVAHVRTVETFQ